MYPVPTQCLSLPLLSRYILFLDLLKKLWRESFNCLHHIWRIACSTLIGTLIGMLIGTLFCRHCALSCCRERTVRVGRLPLFCFCVMTVSAGREPLFLGRARRPYVWVVCLFFSLERRLSARRIAHTHLLAALFTLGPPCEVRSSKIQF